jgi:hypothetical protein
MMHLRSSAAVLLRASLAAALALPVALPAIAAQEAAHQLPLNARFATARLHGNPSAEAFRRTFRKKHGANIAHFSFPYGVAADAFGNVYVTNYEANSVAAISPLLKVTSNVITGASNPISIAVDSVGSIFLGNTGGGGGGDVVKYVNGAPALTISNNTSYPFSIGVDEFDDLFIASQGGIAADDPYGNSLFGFEYSGYNVVSLAVGNGNVYGFLDDDYLYGNGSYLLRTDGLQTIVGPSGAVSPVGAACGSNLCWYSDNSNDTLWTNNGSNTNDVQLNYDPGGVAYDQLHNRLFVADPLNNAVHVYNAQTLSLEKTIT